MLVSNDFHSHHRRCGHASGGIDDYIRKAISLGLDCFGVSDHGPAYWRDGDHAQPGTQMAVSQYPVYVAEARQWQRNFDGQIAVKVGVEADFIPGRESDLASWLGEYPLDYALGSVHYAGGRSIFDARRWATDDPDATYAAYYAQVVDAARSGLFDILSHPTAVEAYGPPIRESVADEWYSAVADAASEGGLVVEVNTSGYRKMPDGDEPFPNRRLLRLLIARGVPLTFGSDCHDPGQILFGADRVVSLLTELGVDTDAGMAPVSTVRGCHVRAWRTGLKRTQDEAE